MNRTWFFSKPVYKVVCLRQKDYTLVGIAILKCEIPPWTCYHIGSYGGMKKLRAAALKVISVEAYGFRISHMYSHRFVKGPLPLPDNYTMSTSYSIRDVVKWEVGKTAYPNSFNSADISCSTGLHCWTTLEDAKCYGGDL